jgi:hypothetical protein
LQALQLFAHLAHLRRQLLLALQGLLGNALLLCPGLSAFLMV